MNLDKSSLHLGSSIHKRHGRILARCLGMRWVAGPWKYLGVPTSGGRLKKNDFSELMARIQNRLGSWRADTLSLAGRATLIQTILRRN